MQLVVDHLTRACLVQMMKDVPGAPRWSFSHHVLFFNVLCNEMKKLRKYFLTREPQNGGLRCGRPTAHRPISPSFARRAAQGEEVRGATRITSRDAPGDGADGCFVGYAKWDECQTRGGRPVWKIENRNRQDASNGLSGRDESRCWSKSNDGRGWTMRRRASDSAAGLRKLIRLLRLIRLARPFGEWTVSTNCCGPGLQPTGMYSSRKLADTYDRIEERARVFRGYMIPVMVMERFTSANYLPRRPR